jgi:hypothetical protein
MEHSVSDNTPVFSMTSKLTGIKANHFVCVLSIWSCLEIRWQDKMGKIQMDNKLFETVEQFKYLGTTLTNQNSIQEEIKSRLKSGNACCHSVQNILSSILVSKNVNVYITIILPVVLYGCEAWSFTVRKECRLRVFENRVLRRIFGPKMNKVTGVEKTT